MIATTDDVMKMKEDDMTPMQLLEKKAHIQVAEPKAAEIVSDARTLLVISSGAGQAFLSKLALELVPQPNWNIETTATDGKYLHYNPDYINRLEPSQTIGVICQSVLHCALKHITRKGMRDQKKWDIASDLSCAQSILDCKIKLPPDAAVPGELQYKDYPRDLSAEEYYDLLKKDDPDDGNEDGNEDGDGEGNGAGASVTIQAGQSQSERDEIEAKWDQRMAAAEEHARKRGDMPDCFERFCNEILEPKVDWREQLRDFVNDRAKNDFSWHQPNRRFIGQNIILPGLFSEEIGNIAVAIDTSGSISETELQSFLSEVQGILEAFTCEVTLYYHTSEVYKVQKWKSTDGDLELSGIMSGGTDHIPVFEAIEQEPEPPKCLICLTDAYSSFPKFPPDYPIMWGITGNPNPEQYVPYGQIIDVEL